MSLSSLALALEDPTSSFPVILQNPRYDAKESAASSIYKANPTRGIEVQIRELIMFIMIHVFFPIVLNQTT
jgi:hypothetical protein